MTSTAPQFDPGHPLLGDRVLLEELSDVMFAVIYKVFHRHGPISPRGVGSERAIVGGTSAEDVLQEALEGLLKYPHVGFTGSWRALAVEIARNKARDALTKARKGLRGTDHRPELRTESGDADVFNPQGERIGTVFELLPDVDLDPEDEYLAVRSALDLRDLAREELEGRELGIFLKIRFLGYKRKEIGEELGLSGQRVGQIYDQASRRLEVHPRYPYPSDMGQ